MSRAVVGLIGALLVSSPFIDVDASADNSDGPTFKVAGSVNLAAGSGGVFLNFSGPALRFELGNWSFGPSFFPSLRWNAFGAGDVSPILGAGVFVSYSKFVVSVPFYSVSGQWNPAFGVGYRF